MTLKRIRELRTELRRERISYGELLEIQDAAAQAGIEVTEEMMAGDTFDVLEEARQSQLSAPPRRAARRARRGESVVRRRARRR